MNVSIIRRLPRQFVGAAAILVCFLGLARVRSQSILQSWEGIASNNTSVPPDPHGAPGPEGILATVNLRLTYYTKAGTVVWGPTNLSDFWSSVGNTGNGISDPKAIFDPDSRRFFVIMQENTGSRFWLNVAVSRTSDPRTNNSTAWRFYRLDGTRYTQSNPAGGVNYGGDYPGLAVDSRALYVGYNMYSFNPNGSLNGSGANAGSPNLYILDKARLLNGTGNLVNLQLDGFTLQPVTPIGGSPGNVVYVIADWNTGIYRLHAIADPLGARTVSSTFINVANRGGGPSMGAPQLGSANRIDTLAGKVQGNASWRAGDLWFCATDGPAAGPSVVAYYRLSLGNWPTSGSVTVTEDNIVGEDGFWNFQPAIGLNAAGDVAITWTRSKFDTYTVTMVAFRAAGEAAFGSPRTIKGAEAPNNDGRWGDFFSVRPDPNDGSLWAVGEWTRLDTGTWSTWWAQIQTPAHDFFVNRNSPNPQTQDGSLAFPFTTVVGGVNAIPTHGTLHIFGANYNEALTINKAVTLERYAGPAVTIGAP